MLFWNLQLKLPNTSVRAKWLSGQTLHLPQQVCKQILQKKIRGVTGKLFKKMCLDFREIQIFMLRTKLWLGLKISSVLCTVNFATQNSSPEHFSKRVTFVSSNREPQLRNKFPRFDMPITKVNVSVNNFLKIWVLGSTIHRTCQLQKTKAN